jgi:hypothetical protein
MAVSRSACCAMWTVLETAPSSSANDAKLSTKPAITKSGRAPAGRSTAVPSRMGITGSTQGDAMVKSPASRANSGSSGACMVGDPVDDMAPLDRLRVSLLCRAAALNAMSCVRVQRRYSAIQNAPVLAWRLRYKARVA